MVLGSPQFVAPERARDGVSDPAYRPVVAGRDALRGGRGPVAVRPGERDGDAERAGHRAARPDAPGRPAAPRAHRPAAARPRRRLTAAEAEPLLRSAAASHDEPAGPARSSAVAALPQPPAGPSSPQPRSNRRPRLGPSRRRRAPAPGAARRPDRPARAPDRPGWRGHRLLVAAASRHAWRWSTDDDDADPTVRLGRRRSRPARPAAFACGVAPAGRRHPGGVGVAATRRERFGLRRGLDLVRRPDRVPDRRAGRLGALDRGLGDLLPEIRLAPGCSASRPGAGAGRPGGALEGRGAPAHRRRPRSPAIAGWTSPRWTSSEAGAVWECELDRTPPAFRCTASGCWPSPRRPLLHRLVVDRSSSTGRSTRHTCLMIRQSFTPAL